MDYTSKIISLEKALSLVKSGAWARDIVSGV